jgi:hypothetical protein
MIADNVRLYSGRALSPQPVAPAVAAAPPVVVAPPVVASPVDPAQQYYQRNQAYVRPGEFVYNTPLQPNEEVSFRKWLTDNKVPFDSSAATTDYDMRGFWKALQAGSPTAKSAVDPNDKRLHYPDYWKTPYHQTFSNESQWANPQTAPKWNDKDQLVAPNGTILFDDRAPKNKEQ